MTLTLTLETSAGDNITETAAEMVAVAQRLGLEIKVNFNGTWLHAQSWTDPEAIVAEYREACRADCNAEVQW